MKDFAQEILLMIVLTVMLYLAAFVWGYGTEHGRQFALFIDRMNAQ